jgi:hypothetical protein
MQAWSKLPEVHNRPPQETFPEGIVCLSERERTKGVRLQVERVDSSAACELEQPFLQSELRERVSLDDSAILVVESPDWMKAVLA